MLSRKRFGFGANWESYSRTALTAERIAQARRDFRSLIQSIDLQGCTFLDIGFGQGLTASLAAEAGAIVTAIDIDPDCHTAYRITRNHFSTIRDPEILIGSILDSRFVERLRTRGPFDVVHSWGVLHHTGDMWRAIGNAASLVRPDGHLVIAIYARHWTAPIWTAVKWTYVHSPAFVQRTMIAFFNPLMRMRIRQLGADSTLVRGMEFKHDLVDWIGGYPYQYASRQEIESHVLLQDFKELAFRPAAGMTGCHEYVLRRSAVRPQSL